jgi:hypothetical protein
MAPSLLTIAAGELGPVEDDLATSANSLDRADEQERQGDRGACQRDVEENTAGYPEALLPVSLLDLAVGAAGSAAI